MPINFPCTKCQRTIRVPDGSEGKKTKCPECQEIQRIPDNAASASPPPPAAPLGDLGGGGSSGGGLWDNLESDKPSSSAGGKSNPFGDGPDPFGAPSSNPYASPSSPVGPRALSRESARNKLMGPAIGVMVSVGLGLLYTAFSFVIQYANLEEILANADLKAPEQRIGFYVGFFGVTGLILVSGIFTIASMVRALQVRNYGLVMAGFILAMTPCPSSCVCILGIPFSIWGIVMMMDQSVKDAFKLP